LRCTPAPPEIVDRGISLWNYCYCYVIILVLFTIFLTVMRFPIFAIAPVLLVTACGRSTAPAPANLPAVPTITFIARSLDPHNPQVYLSDMPCPMDGRLAYIDQRISNKDSFTACWHKADNKIVLDYFGVRKEIGDGHLDVERHYSNRKLSEFALLPGNAWPVDKSASAPQATPPEDAFAPAARPAAEPAQQADWYAVDASFSSCHASTGPAARMRELIDEGHEPITKNSGPQDAPDAVEVGFYRSDDFSYRTYYRSLERCELEQTTDGKKTAIPSMYR
jgi:hypothetical protein